MSSLNAGFKMLVGFKFGTSTTSTHNELMASNNAIMLGGLQELGNIH